MFEHIEMAPPDAILGLTEAFKNDPNPAKINLGVGVYKDASDATPVLPSVKRAEEWLLAAEKTKSYMPIPGAADYCARVGELVFGAGHEAAVSGRIATAHTPGGTGGLRVGADFIKQQLPGAAVWVSDPTWANHRAIFQAAGVPVKVYPYYDAAGKGLKFDAMLTALRAVPAGDVVLLHGCCHNPTGIDPDPGQWREIAGAARAGKWLPFVDFAYQGLGDGLDEDAAGVRTLCAPGQEMLVCSSFSKNFGLYCERTGALTLAAADKDAAARAFSQIKTAIRANYSNPPAHGAAIVSTVLGDPVLRAQWDAEVSEMRARINGMRKLFVETLAAKGVKQDFSFIARQKGMFSFSGLNKEQVDALRETFAIYIVGGGRINVAGMTEANMDRLCEAIASVM